MNIPHVIHFRSNILIKDDEPKKHAEKVSKIHFRKDDPEHHIKKVSKLQFEKGDPNFVDERKKSESPKKEESFLSSLLE